MPAPVPYPKLCTLQAPDGMAWPGTDCGCFWACRDAQAGDKAGRQSNLLFWAMARLYWPRLSLQSSWVLMEIGIRCVSAPTLFLSALSACCVYIC